MSITEKSYNSPDFSKLLQTREKAVVADLFGSVELFGVVFRKGREINAAKISAQIVEKRS